jgi:hypothetical protein
MGFVDGVRKGDLDDQRFVTPQIRVDDVVDIVALSTRAHDGNFERADAPPAYNLRGNTPAVNQTGSRGPVATSRLRTFAVMRSPSTLSLWNLPRRARV